MCELFGLSSHQPAALTYSLNEFALHGGSTYKNNSGWGIAYFQGREALLVKEPEPASDSPWVRFIAEQQIKSNCVVAHVRLATVGSPALENTHPFRRALAGQVHVFAHNGTLKGLKDDISPGRMNHHPIGDTDSELAFCVLMDEMQKLRQASSTTPPTIEERLETFAGFASDMRKRGSANFLYSDGEALYVHADQRIYEEHGGFSDPRPPGLSVRKCVSCQQGPEYACSGLQVGLEDQRTMLFASVPLDEAGWEALPQGTALAASAGEEVARLTT